MIHHNGRRLGYLLRLLVLPLGSGPVADGPDDTGNRELHGPKQRENGGNAQNHIAEHFAAEPLQEHSQYTAENAAALAGNALLIQGKNIFEAHIPGFRRQSQVGNTPAQQHEGYHADHTGANGPLLAECKNKEQVQRGRDGNNEAHVADEAPKHGGDQFGQRPLRL